MRNLAFFLAFLSVSFSSMATTVHNTAGNLSRVLTDTRVTHLTITGTMDARDFKYISRYLDALESVDLSGVDIVAYQDLSTPLLGTQFSFEAKVIPQASFFGKPLSRVVLPSDTRAIGYAAFTGCSRLTSISIPESVDSIASYAFNATGLTSVAIPARVTVVGDGAFSRCLALTSATVPNGRVGKFAFLGDTKLGRVTLGTVKTIGAGAFCGCTALKALTWTDFTTLASIGDEAFMASGMENADLSRHTSLSHIGNWTFANSQVKAVQLPPTVASVGDGAFYYAPVSNLVLPRRVTKVGDYTFAGSSVSNANVMSRGVTAIGNYAFFNADKVTNLMIPVYVTRLGNMAMAGMTGLVSIDARPGDAPALGDSVWAGIDQSAVELRVIKINPYLAAEQWKEFNIVKAHLLGDVNDDGIVNVTDVTALINTILGATPWNEGYCDINADGIINVTDVTALINLIITGEDQIIKGKITASNTTDGLAMSDLDLRPGETRVLEIGLNNALAYASLQFDLHLPSGLSMEDYAITDRTCAHLMTVETLDDGSIRMIAHAERNEVIVGGEGAILQLTVKASQGLAAESEILADNIVLATADSKQFFPDDACARVSNTTGVEEVSASAVKVYTRGGVLVIESQEATTAQLVALNGTSIGLLVEAGHNEYGDIGRGIYIVRINGTSFKVLVK